MDGTDTGTNYYATKLGEGQWYQDFVSERLFHEGIVLGNYQTRDFQHRLGENALGLEIKYDQKMASTGNVYIETSEKTHPDNPVFVASGIYAHARMWLYGIGDQREFFLFSVKRLKAIDVHGCGGLQRRGTPTSHGFTLPRDVALKAAERHFNWKTGP